MLVPNRCICCVFDGTMWQYCTVQCSVSNRQWLFTRFRSCEWPKSARECTNGTFQVSLRVTRPDFSVLCSPNLDFYWLDLLRKKTVLSKYNYQCTVLMAWHKCCSVWRTSVHSSQYDWTHSGTSIVRFGRCNKNLKIKSEQAQPRPDRKKKCAKEVEKPPTIVIVIVVVMYQLFSHGTFCGINHGNFWYHHD